MVKNTAAAVTEFIAAEFPELHATGQVAANRTMLNTVDGYVAVVVQGSLEVHGSCNYYFDAETDAERELRLRRNLAGWKVGA